jgi:hypothetical protein
MLAALLAAIVITFWGGDDPSTSSNTIFLMKVAVDAKDNYDNDDVRLRVSIRKDTMVGVPSCQHTFSQIELLNLVRSLSCVFLFCR